MANYEKLVKDAISDVRSKDFETRVRGYNILSELSEDIEFSVDIKIMELVVKEAAQIKIKPEEPWDVPSCHLLEFVSEYDQEPIIRAVAKHLDEFEGDAINMALLFLAKCDIEIIMDTVLTYLKNNLPKGEIILPVTSLAENPTLAMKVLHTCESYFEDSNYRVSFFRLLRIALRNEWYRAGYKSEKFEHLILQEIKTLLPKIMEYDESYSTRNVYLVWKDVYSDIQLPLRTYISLFEYYFSDELEEVLKQAISLKDPVIKAQAIITSIVQNIAVSEQDMLGAATHMETSAFFFAELERINKLRLHPIKTKKQPYFAVTSFFNFLMDHPDYDSFPDEIKVVDIIDTTNHYKQPIRYYMVTFNEEGKEPVVGYVGAYPTEEDDDHVVTWDGNYTDFIKFNTATIEEHRVAFFKRRDEEGERYANEVHYVGKPAWGVLLPIYSLFVGFRLLSFNRVEQGIQIAFIVMAAIALLWFGYRWMERMQKRVELRGRTLHIIKGKKETEIKYTDIKKIERQGRNIVVIGVDGKEIARFGKRYINKDVFKYKIEELNMYLSNPLYVDKF